MLDFNFLDRKDIFFNKADIESHIDSFDKYQSLKKKRGISFLSIVKDLVSSYFNENLFDLNYINSGTFNDVFDIKISDQNYIIKINYSKIKTIHLDYKINKIIYEKGIPCVQPLFIDTSRKKYDFDYFIMSKAKGVSLTGYKDNSSLFSILLENLGRVISLIHQIKIDGFGLLDYQGNKGLHHQWESYLFLKLNEHINFCFQKNDIDAHEKKDILHYFDKYRYLFTLKKGSLLHGDLGNHNIFCKKTHITAIIDWEDSLIGDPVYDISLWATFHPDQNHEAFMRGYFGESTRYFSMKFWLYYLRISLAKTVHRHKFGHQDINHNLKASTRIQKALKYLNRLS